MSAIKFIYFEGCPNAQKTKDLLQELTTDFDIIRQDDLTTDNPYRNYSSPTILRNGEIILGSAASGGGCSLQLPNKNELRRRLNINVPNKKIGILSTLGSLGSAVTVGFCPFCIPAIGAFLSAIGLGFLVQESVLKPLLFIFLFVTLAGLFWSYRKQHGRLAPFFLGIVTGSALYVGRYVYLGAAINQILMYGGIVGIIVVSFWNLKLKKKASCSACVN
ncbi:MAG: MerC family mercury resistance protein [Bdellovibrio sp.]|nr:MerC family mercury resistance protein [Bdellovibrio sp.]